MLTLKRIALLFLLILLLSIIAACGGGTPTSPTPQPTLIPTRSIPTSTPTQVVATPALKPSPTISVSPTAVAVQPRVTVTSGQAQSAPWSQTQRGVTASLFFEPTPPQLGSTTNYRVVLADAAGQPITDVIVELNIIGAMPGMEGEHDENYTVNLPSQGNGAYTAQASVGHTNEVLSGMTLFIQRSGQTWLFTISKTDLPSR